jgi:hypothetical protein
MDFELRTIPGCPNSGPALKLFREVLAADGRDAESLTVHEVASEREPKELQVRGSPSFIAEGRDLFPAESAPVLSCRLYRTGHSAAGLPSVESLRNALRGIDFRP